MIESRAAQRYARALIGIAEEMKKIDEVSNDFACIEKLMRESNDFFLFVKSPVVSKQKKKTVFAELFKTKFSDVTMKFILLLTSKGREGLLPDIIQQFYKLRDERMGILNVTARTVVAMNKTQEEQLIRSIQDLTKKKVRIKRVADPSLIGGFTVQYDDTVLDASVKRQLEILRERFATS
ncbi:MAG: ATP synthase F1 subunit delta [Ignavibacteriae bacterium]|nr:ATP synthase F1 subunit delta [Ignavibacteria bacterium]MBI3365381.1 ATP synthase F1 subunit delta [Ignavibacteriota bacterium]